MLYSNSPLSLYSSLIDHFYNPGASATPVGPTDSWLGGTVMGIGHKAEYLSDLGFQGIHVTPVDRQAPTGIGHDGLPIYGYHGYHRNGLDFEIEPRFGTRAEYECAIRKVQNKGVGWWQDIAFNHVGYGSNAPKEHPEWFHPQDLVHSVEDWKRPFVEWHYELPDLNQDHPVVREKLNEQLRMLREIGVAGVRLDMPHLINYSYWEQAYQSGGVAFGFPTIAEVFDGNPEAHRGFWQLGMRTICYPLYFAIVDALARPDGNTTRVANTFAWLLDIVPNPLQLVTFLDNHDLDRWPTLCMDQGCSRNDALERLDMVLTLLYGCTGIPMIYQGTEYGAEGRNDLHHTNREMMNFEAARASKLSNRIQRLNHARRVLPALVHGAQLERYKDHGALAFARTMSGHAPALTVLNNRDFPLVLETLPGGVWVGDILPTNARPQEATFRRHGLFVNNHGQLTGELPPRTTLLLTSPAAALD